MASTGKRELLRSSVARLGAANKNVQLKSVPLGVETEPPLAWCWAMQVQMNLGCGEYGGEDGMDIWYSFFLLLGFAVFFCFSSYM